MVVGSDGNFVDPTQTVALMARYGGRRHAVIIVSGADPHQFRSGRQFAAWLGLVTVPSWRVSAPSFSEKATGKVAF
jgi:transposase